MARRDANDFDRDDDGQPDPAAAKRKVRPPAVALIVVAALSLLLAVAVEGWMALSSARGAKENGLLTSERQNPLTGEKEFLIPPRCAGWSASRRCSCNWC